MVPVFDNLKLDKFLNLFGLRDDFTADDLNSSYRTLAKLNHPDVNRDSSSDLRMMLVNEGFEYLKAFHLNMNGFSSGARTYAGSNGVHDPIYDQYKKAFNILKVAFDDYFGHENNSPKERSDILIERLKAAKFEFSKIINDFPYNQWVSDAIDKINSINTWLE